MIKMILASTVDGGIGLDNKLPFHCPEDLKYFKEQTEDGVVLMGRSTWESLPSFPSGLPFRNNYVVSSKIKPQLTYSYDYPREESLHFHRNLEDTLNTLGVLYNEESVWGIGGKSLYEQLFHLVDEVHHTIIKGDYECDTFIDTSMWEDDIDWCLEDVKTLSEVAEVRIWRKC